MAEHPNYNYNQNNQHPHQIELTIQPNSRSSLFELGASSSQESQISPATATSSTSSPSDHDSINASHYEALMSDYDNGLKLKDIVHPELLRDSDNNTLLHIAASAGQVEHIKYLVDHTEGHLLRCTNSKGDLSVHVAARAGHFQAVELLVDLAVQYRFQCSRSLMLSSVNKDKNTALHIALENEQGPMAEYLFDQHPAAFYQLNSQGISPLYLAVKGKFWDLAKKMLHSGEPWNPEAGGKSVVHLAIMAQNKDILDIMLSGDYADSLIYSVDENGRPPLSYAAYTGFLEGVKCILQHFPNQVFKPCAQDGSFPIHMACIGGNLKVIQHLLSDSRGPKTVWLLNKMGQSILHVASQSGKAEVVKCILGHSEFESMINMKDENGYTPLHLATMGRHPKVVYMLTWDSRVKLSLQCKNGLTALDLAEDYGDVPSFDERLTWLALRYAGVPRAPQYHLLNTEIPNTSHDGKINGVALVDGKYYPVNSIIDSKFGSVATIRANHPKKRKNKYKERLNTLLIISTLVATVTFASGFAVPGGFNNNNPQQGMATLDHKCAFQVFVVSNTIALYSSILTVVTLIWAHLDDVRLILLSLDLALPLLGISLTMMSIAFTAGLYVVMQNLFWLSIVVLAMEGVFLGVLLIFYVPLYSPRSCIKYRILRYVFHYPFKLMLLACES